MHTERRLVVGVFRKEYFYTVPAFLLESELKDSLDAATKAADEWLEPIPEYERLAANQPSDQLPSKYPKVTDGTAASISEEQPMRVWGQLQTGRIIPTPFNGSDDYLEWKRLLIELYWTNDIIPNANTTAEFFTKVKLATEKAGHYGSQPLYVFPVSEGQYTGSDFILPYIKDVKLEPGKVSDKDCSYIWLAQHYTKLELRGIIEAAKKVPDRNGWDIVALQAIVDSNAFRARTEDLPEAVKEKTDHGKTVTFYTCFHRGYGAPWTTIYKDGTTTDPSGVVRRRKNKLPSGDIPVFLVYHKMNLINPYGVSMFDLIGPGQNLLDFSTAAQAYGMQKALDPPVKVSGKIDADSGLDLDSLDAGPDGIVFAGTNDVDYMIPDKTVLSAFPQLIGVHKTNLLNLAGTNDGTVSGSSSGNSTYSKVPSSIKQLQERRNARDNNQRQIADVMMATLAKLMINTAIHASTGYEAIRVNADDLAKLKAAGYNVPENAKKAQLEFDEIRDALFEWQVDPGSSKLEEDDATKERVSEAIEKALSITDIDAKLAKDRLEIHWGPLLQNYFEKAGIDKTDKIIVPMSNEETETEENKESAALVQMNMAAQNIKQQQEEEKLAQQRLKTGEQAAKTEAAIGARQVAQAVNPTEQNRSLVQALQQAGWSEEDINDYLERVRGVQTNG